MAPNSGSFVNAALSMRVGVFGVQEIIVEADCHI